MKKVFYTLAKWFDLRDLFVFGGLLTLGYGASLVYQPAGLIIIGGGLFWLGVRK